MRRPSRRRGLRSGLAVLALVGATACGGGDSRQLAGMTREPEPQVDATPLPDVSDGDTPFTMHAADNGLLVVYFGYTHCPDVCPTTLADLGQALTSMDPDQAARVQVAMVTVDPDRDLPVLTDYVQSFVPGAHALGTDDQATLQAAAGPFGVSYQVTTNPDGEIDVGHSSQLYVVDQDGRLVLTWTFGTSADDIGADLDQLLGNVEA